MFKFTAKRGQHLLVASVLFRHGMWPTLTYNGGVVVVTATIPKHLSKRKVNKLLYAAGVPGAVSCRNKYPVRKLPGWWAISSLSGSLPSKFIAVVGGKMHLVHWHWAGTIKKPYVHIVNVKTGKVI